MHVTCIDGRHALYRFAHVGKNLRASTGEETGAIHHLLTGMLTLKQRYPSTKFVVVWDGLKTADSWRNAVFPEYKANRRGVVTEELKELRASVNRQIGNIKKLLDGIGVSQLEIAELEADDVIGILCARITARGWNARIYSTDQDYWQLMAYHVEILKTSYYGDAASDPIVQAADVQHKWKCGVKDLLKLRALLGDVSDGIPRAVSGVGPVAAARYIEAGVDPELEQFDDLSRDVRLNAERLRSYWPDIHRNWRLMRILRSGKDSELSEATSVRVNAETSRVMRELIAPAVRSQAAYEEMLQVFAKLELSLAMENRHAIWRLQSV